VLRHCAISLFLVLVWVPAGTCAWGRTRPHYGGTLHVEVEGDAWQGADGLAHRLVFDGLTSLDADGAVQPALAASWKSDDDGHRWEFRLRSNVQFHNGSPLTAAAVVMSLNLACNANCPWTAVRAVGSSLVFTSESPLPSLPALLAGDGFLIQLTRTADGQTPSQPTGTGPFQVASNAGNILTLTANENCWRGRPFADQVVLTSHRALRDQWLDLSVGRADVVEVPAEQLRQAQQRRLTVSASLPVLLLAIQVSNSGALANPAMRAAIAHAVDRSALYNVIFQKQGEVTASLLPQSLSGYAFLFPTGRDLNKANELRGGLSFSPLTLRTDGDGAMQLTAQRLALNLREAGFIVQMTAANVQHADLVLTKLPIAGSDPAGALASILFAAGQTPSITGHDPEALFRIEHDFLDSHTIVPLLDLPRAYAAGSRVHNFSLRADGTPNLASASVEDAP
jgi:peptide/nickel transport system substrate-binding protein